MSTELQRIELLRRILQSHAAPGVPGVRGVPGMDGVRGVPGVEVGIGDDAAVIGIDGKLVVSVDAMVEHVHFERAWIGFADLGYKATMAALSDLAAMGARPRGVLGSLILPVDVNDAELEELARGQREACDELAAPMVGGNLARGRELSITTTVLGSAAAVLQRSGARPGHGLWLAGEVGLAAQGLAALREGRNEPEAIAAWRRPRAQIELGLIAGPISSAAIDISDGLARDAAHLADASGVAAVFDQVSEEALHGGEDYALLVASAHPVPGFRRIGRCEEGAGVWLEREGRREPVAPRGWDHFDSES